ncbi:hypothetical protein R3P38DRAFT_927432 [Favolaschia claudopus]|uniref:F-box domain-containing protein n=1 Tax=Favolaschia claudopus TaxID=2862362 RepID=A0AAW0BQ90_9AGAR
MASLSGLSGLRGRYASRRQPPVQRSAAERFLYVCHTLYHVYTEIDILCSDLAMGPHDALFSLLDTRELVRLMSTSRRIRSLTHEICFDISRLLRRFFGSRENVEQFRRMQQQTGTIISGSMGLQFFNRLTWEDSDLDLYVGRAMASLAAVFILENGYTFKAKENQELSISLQLPLSVNGQRMSYLGRGIADVFDFHKGEQKIQLIVAVTSPMEITLNFHSTCVMNFITHSTAFSLYPWHTFVLQKALIIETVGTGQEIGRQKYIDRGWTMLEFPASNSNSELGVRIPRCVGDSFTWSIPLPPLPPLVPRMPMYDYPVAPPVAEPDPTETAWLVDCMSYKVSMVLLENVRTPSPSPPASPAPANADVAEKIERLRKMLHRLEVAATNALYVAER